MDGTIFPKMEGQSYTESAGELILLYLIVLRLFRAIAVSDRNLLTYETVNKLSYKENSRAIRLDAYWS